MKITLSKAEVAKLVRSPVPGYVVTDADWTSRKEGPVELTLEPVVDATVSVAMGQTTEALR